MEISQTDFRKIMSYLEEASSLYEALTLTRIPTDRGEVPLLRVCRLRPGYAIGKCKCRAHMIRQLISKLKNKSDNSFQNLKIKKKNDETRHH